MTFDNVLAAFFEGWSCSFRAFQRLLFSPCAPSPATLPPAPLPPFQLPHCPRFATDRRRADPLLAIVVPGSHTPGSRARLRFDQRDRAFWQLQRDDRQERRPLLPDPLQPRPVTVSFEITIIYIYIYISGEGGIRRVSGLEN